MNSTFKAALWMTGAIASFSSMAIGGRALSLDLDTFEIMFYRSLIGFLIVLTLASATGAIRQVNTRNMGLHAARNICHFTGQNLWFFAIGLIPLAQVFALEFTSPLWVILLSPIVLGERLTRSRAIAAALGFVGILIVTRPSPDTLSPGLISAALCAIGFAGSAVFTRRLTRTETITCIMFWLTGMQTLFGLICAGFDGDIALPAVTSWPWVAMISVAGLVAHFCLTKALSLAPASVVMPIDFVRLPAIALIGMSFYAEPLDLYVILGAVIIFGANYYNILRETRPTVPVSSA